MTLNRRLLLQASAAAGLAGSMSGAFAQTKDGVSLKEGLNIVELFTSQGCSSCPPADAALLELTKDPSTIALTYPVEIWDYLGWKDTLAKPAFTKRQRSYADRVAKHQVYTPQAIINGKSHCVGSDNAAMTRLRKIGMVGTPSTARFTLVPEQDGWKAAFSAAPTKPYHLMLAIICARETVAIGRGENRGRTITYGNVVRDLRPLANLDEILITQSTLKASNCDSFALFAQSGTPDAPGDVLAAALYGPTGIRA